ncbi:MAG: MarR family transcriptional regulator [Chloroflexota bacterium]|jgi:ArsR family transcriptional regulator, arsenate/arsenite/antimonite-responsive transcriptional repressor / arsenate reductase (thioredoxin)
MNASTISDSSMLPFLKLLAHELRWILLAELAASDRRVGELVSSMGRPQNLVSYHLAQLRDGGLVTEQRSSADGRDIYYTLDLSVLGEGLRRSGGALHPALGGSPNESSRPAAGRLARVLFLCTHNSARSQMAEALLQAVMGEGALVASAGSEPSAVHPLAVRVMAERGIDISRRRSKHLGELTGQSWDRVITVCDRVREVCPVFPQETVTAHWSVRDPAAVVGDEDERLAVFRTAAGDIERRIDYFKWVIQSDSIH